MAAEDDIDSRRQEQLHEEEEIKQVEEIKAELKADEEDMEDLMRGRRAGRTVPKKSAYAQSKPKKKKKKKKPKEEAQ